MLNNEKGVALVITLLLLVLLTLMGMSAIMMSSSDNAQSGNYRGMKTGDAATDAGVELAMSMIFANSSSLKLPKSIAGNPTWAGSRDIRFKDEALDVTFNVTYKREDNINYYNATPKPYADNVVRYGKDYNYASAPKNIGKQPVFTIKVTDNKTGAKSEADIISSFGFKTPGAIFAYGTLTIEKNPWATEEIIRVRSATGTPALATTTASSSCFIQHAVSKRHKTGGTTNQWEYKDQNNIWNEYDLAASGVHAMDDVYTDTEIAAYGNYTSETVYKKMHCQLKSGSNCFQGSTSVVKYSYNTGGKNLEDLMGITFVDLRDLADVVITGDETVTIPGGTTTGGKDLTPLNGTLGSATPPIVGKVVFCESNYNDDGTVKAGAKALTLAGTASGAGVLAVNGDLTIQGSLDWSGLMVIRGKLTFRPWEGGTDAVRSPPTLGCDWNGWIMGGSNLELWTWYGGKIVLGYDSTDVAKLKGIIANAIPHKVLSWKRVYR